MGTESRLAWPLLLIDCFDLSLQHFQPLPPTGGRKAERMFCTSFSRPWEKTTSLKDYKETRDYIFAGVPRPEYSKALENFWLILGHRTPSVKLLKSDPCLGARSVRGWKGKKRKKRFYLFLDYGVERLWSEERKGRCVPLTTPASSSSAAFETRPGQSLCIFLCKLRLACTPAENEKIEGLNI
jgi:hypothetical protein